MKKEEINTESVKALLLDEALVWEEQPGPEGFPLVRAFLAKSNDWRFLIAVGPMEKGGNVSHAGTATVYDKATKEAVLLIIPTSLVQAAFDIAAGKNKPKPKKKGPDFLGDTREDLFNE